MSEQHRPVVRDGLTAVAHAPLQQLRDAIRRLTTAPLTCADQLDEEAFLAGVDVRESTWAEWEETTFEVRHIHA